jgi:hypothetical protein
VSREVGSDRPRLFLLLDPLDVPAHPLVGQEELSRIVVPAQVFLVLDQVVNAAVAPPAKPQAPVPHFVDGEPLAEPPLAVAMARDEVVERQGLARTPTQLAGANLPLLGALPLVDIVVTWHCKTPLGMNSVNLPG